MPVYIYRAELYLKKKEFIVRNKSGRCILNVLVTCRVFFTQKITANAAQEA